MNKPRRTARLLAVLVFVVFAVTAHADEISQQTVDKLRATIENLQSQNEALRRQLQGNKGDVDTRVAEPLSQAEPLFGDDDSAEPDELMQELMGDFAEFEAGQDAQTPDLSSEEYSYLNLGVDEDYARSERLRLKDQILTFIPPLYQPAFLGHAYVLPPRVVRIAAQTSFLEIDSDDFFKNHDPDPAHANHRASLRTINLDLFYGLDHDMTVRVNIPYKFVSSRGFVHPGGVPFLDAFVEGDSNGLGDVSVFLKKKWWDQGNYGFNFATAAGVRFPTGANDKKFNFPVSVRNNNAGMIVPAGGDGVFRRFSDDGRLPSSLQLGGHWGAHAGVFATRQFIRFPSALHVGTLATFLETNDGIDPGHRVRFFGTFVKPVYRDFIAVEMGVNGMWKQDDEYAGLFTPPGAPGPMPRPSFQGGTVVFASPALVISPSPPLRFTLSASFRLNDPELGPWPSQIFRLGFTSTF